MQIPASGRTRFARSGFRTFEIVPQDLLHLVAEQSRTPGYPHGSTGNLTPDADPTPSYLAQSAGESSRTLMLHARPVLESLYDHIMSTHSAVLLSDAAGLILYSMGRDEVLSRYSDVKLRKGELGSNAAACGTAGALSVCSIAPQGTFEHCLASDCSLSCSAAAIFDAQGQAMGALYVVGEDPRENAHALALARMSACMIENQMLCHAFEDAVIVRFHLQPECLGTLSEGIIAFTADGSLMSCNASGRQFLELRLKEHVGRPFAMFFHLPFRALLEHAQSQAHLPVALRTRSGHVVTARIELGAKVKLQPRARTRRHDGEPREPSSAACEPAAGGALAALLSGDPQIEHAVDKLRKMLSHDIVILIQGETGTGKEVLARAIHEDGPRSRGPFVAVNCAAIPEGLIESELFGYEEGAFTGARRKGHGGRIRQADGGTLFLDEIGDMPKSLQARLLRFMQERIVTPLGSRNAYPVKVAIVCATNRKLRELVAGGEFREDLYYRLNGITVNLPALRERTDLRRVTERILCEEAGGGTAARITAEVMDLFLRHPWPGNLRQLTNVLRAALVMCDADAVIRAEHLPEDFLDDLRRSEGGAVPESRAAAEAEGRTSPAADLHSVELSAIKQALRFHAGNISAASRQLGISRNTLYRKLSSL
jgi:transcriptional regulator of acetoin/glycerol metabolism